MVKGLEIQESVLSNEEYISLINNEIKEYNVITESIDRSFNVLEYLEKNQEKGLDELATELLNININNIFKETNISSRDIIPAIECFENEHTKQYAVKVSMEGLWSTIKGLFAALMEKIRTIISFFKKWARNGLNALEEKKQEKKIESFSDRLKNIEDYYKDQANRQHPIILDIERHRKIVKDKGIDRIAFDVGTDVFDNSLINTISNNSLQTLAAFSEVISVFEHGNIDELIKKISEGVNFELEHAPGTAFSKKIKGINTGSDLQDKMNSLNSDTFKKIYRTVTNAFSSKNNIFYYEHDINKIQSHADSLDKFNPEQFKGSKDEFINKLKKADSAEFTPGNYIKKGVFGSLVASKEPYRNQKIYILLKSKSFTDTRTPDVVNEIVNRSGYDECKYIPEFLEMSYIIFNQTKKTELKSNVKIFTTNDLKKSITSLEKIHTDVFKNYKINITSALRNFEKANVLSKTIYDVLDKVDSDNKTQTFDTKYYITFLRSFFLNSRKSIASFITLNNLCVNYIDRVGSHAFTDLGSVINKNLEIYEEAMKFDSWVEYYNSFEKA